MLVRYLLPIGIQGFSTHKEIVDLEIYPIEKKKITIYPKS